MKSEASLTGGGDGSDRQGRVGACDVPHQSPYDGLIVAEASNTWASVRWGSRTMISSGSAAELLLSAIARTGVRVPAMNGGAMGVLFSAEA